MQLKHDSSDEETIVEFLDDINLTPAALSLTSEDADAVFDFSEKIGETFNAGSSNKSINIYHSPLQGVPP